MRRAIQSRVRRRVILTLKNGSSFRGVLFEADRDAFVLRDVEHLVVREGPSPVDGELLVLAADVLYLQFV